MHLALQRVEKYELRATLAKMPLSTVHEAWDPDFERLVAIKMIPLSAAGDYNAAEALVRFKQGAKAAARLSHPNLVAVYDYGEAEGYAYLVMELIDGPTLKAKFDEKHQFNMPETRSIMGGILDALQYSHDNGVVHRDIKPENIMFTKKNQVKITDFGIARLENSEMTQAGMVLGSPPYMSPEQFTGQIDSRTDIYSTGVVLYEMLTGERAYTGNLTTIMHKKLYGPPPVPTHVPAALTQSLGRVVARAMARDREDRFASASEFHAALLTAMAPAAPKIERAAFAPDLRAAKRPSEPAQKHTAATRPRTLLIASVVAVLAIAGGALAWVLQQNPQPETALAPAHPTGQPEVAASQTPRIPPPGQSQNPTPPSLANTVPAPPADTPPAPDPERELAAQRERLKDYLQAQQLTPAMDESPPASTSPPEDLVLPPPIVASAPPAPSPPAPEPPPRKPAATPNTTALAAPVRPPADRPKPAPRGRPAATESSPPAAPDSTTAALARIRTELEKERTPPALLTPPPPVPDAVPLYAAKSTSAVGLLCESITAETAPTFGLETPQGMLVTGVTVGSPAYAAGIRQDDVILKIKGRSASNLSLLSQVAREAGSPRSVPVEVLRHGKRQMVQLDIAQLR